MKKKLSKESALKFLVVIIFFFQIVWNYGVIFFGNNNKIEQSIISSGLVLIIGSIYSVYSYRRNILAVILHIMLAYFNYSVVVSVCWNLNNLHSIFNGYTYDEQLNGISIVLVFWCSYIVTIQTNIGFDRLAFKRQSGSNEIFVFGCVVYTFCAPFLFYSSAEFGERGGGSPLYEYTIIIILVGIYFTGRRKKNLIALGAASTFFSLHGLLYGERVSALQITIIWGIYLLLDRLDVKTIMIACVGGVVGLTVVGMVRGISAWHSGAIKEAVDILLEERLANSTSYFAYQSGLSIYRLEFEVPLINRLIQFGAFVFYIFLGSIVPNSNLSVIASEYNHNWGGGWLPFYCHFWFGIIGVIFMAVFVGKIVQMACSPCMGSYYKNYLRLYVIATVPRWYLYSPSAICRGILIFTVLFFVLNLMDRQLKKRFGYMRE